MYIKMYLDVSAYLAGNGTNRETRERMAAKRVKFSSQVSPDLLAGMRAIAKHEGRRFQSVLEDAMSSYIEAKAQGKVRPEVMAHFRASLERNRRLGELLADS